LEIGKFFTYFVLKNPFPWKISRKITFHKKIGFVLRTFDPDVGRGRDGEDEQEEDEGERLQVVGGDALHAEQDGAQQLALRRVEARAEDVGDAAVVGRAETRRRFGRRGVLGPML
jgi:hypothetical protein